MSRVFEQIISYTRNHNYGGTHTHYEPRLARGRGPRPVDRNCVYVPEPHPEGIQKNHVHALALPMRRMRPVHTEAGENKLVPLYKGRRVRVQPVHPRLFHIVHEAYEAESSEAHEGESHEAHEGEAQLSGGCPRIAARGGYFE